MTYAILKNNFKAALKRSERQIGYWAGLGSLEALEILGHAGFDWVLIDGEHAPIGVSDLKMQLMAVQATPAEAVVRLVSDEDWMIKQALDLGARSLLIPMVETPEQAQRLVRATRYAPRGHRGMASGVVRASGYGQQQGYVQEAEAQICLLVQVETVLGLENLDAILAVEGVDGVFIGPADLAASMGLAGQQADERVLSVIDEAMARIRQAGKAAGILQFEAFATERAIQAGATFIAVGSDVASFAKIVRSEARVWRRVVAETKK